MKYKKGDRVKVIRVKGSPLRSWQIKHLGKIGVVEENDPNPYVKFEGEDGRSCFNEEKLELVGSSFKFKIGDILKVKSKYREKCPSFNGKDGEYIEIIATNDDEYYSYNILDNDRENIGGCFGCFTDEMLEPVSETKEIEQKFKVGDKVQRGDRILTVKLIPGMEEYDGIGYSSAEEGFMAEESGWYWQTNWELAKEEELEVKTKMKYKIGDNIRIINDEYDKCDGQIGPIEKIDDDALYPYYIRLDDGELHIFRDSEIELADGKKSTKVKKIELRELEKTTVNPRTKAEFDELMQIYKDAGWETLDNWEIYEDTYCIDALSDPHYADINYSRKEGETIISFNEFKRQQGLDTNTITHLKGAIMNILSVRQKKAFNSNIRAFFKLGWFDEELRVTEEGREALGEFGFDQFEKELGAIAKKKVIQLKKRERKNSR